MSRVINTATELEALPAWAAVEDVLGVAWVKHPAMPGRADVWVSYYGEHVALEAPLTVLHDPSEARTAPAPVVPVVSDAAVSRGLAQSAAGETVDLGDFTQYLIPDAAVEAAARSPQPRPEGGPMSGVATLLKGSLPGYNGQMNLYRLDPPFKYYDYTEDGEASTAYVFVSAAHVAYIGRDETYIFPADGPDATEPSDWLELPGSLNDVLSHEEALRAAGYEVDNA